ncbi:hypothetical protein QAD02_006786 [Eretmocerus hayati]|uniref:Uncharacterized protein n=1 Tax=Eretmocerus hayati TaxID=131215 RepID=A0ACC2N1V2_9HYME|nr:hypothetical protein QAD02_006786 [Eretmocerus hayati]
MNKILYVVVVIFGILNHPCSSVVTNKEKLLAHIAASLYARIRCGLLYTLEDFDSYRHTFDDRNFQQRLSYYYPERNDPEKKIKRLRGKKMDQVLENLTILRHNLRVFQGVVANENGELEAYFRRAVSAYDEAIKNRIFSGTMIRWPHISYNANTKKVVVTPEVFLDDLAPGTVISPGNNGATSEINYDEHVEFKPSYHERQSQRYNFELTKHIDVSFLADGVGEDIRTEVRQRIKERLLQGSRNKVPSAHHMISFERLSNFGNHYSMLLNLLKNRDINRARLFTQRKIENEKLHLRGQMVRSTFGGNSLSVEQYYSQVFVKDVDQPAGNLFYGPDPRLRDDDNKDKFDVKAQVIWTPKEFQSLRNLESELTSFLEQHDIMSFREIIALVRETKPNNEDLTQEEKLGLVEENVLDMIRRETGKELENIVDSSELNFSNVIENYRAFEKLKSILEDFGQTFMHIATTFYTIRSYRNLEAGEPLPFYPNTWEVSTTNRWRILTVEQVHSNILNERLPDWLRAIIEEIQNEKNITIPLKFEPLAVNEDHQTDVPFSPRAYGLDIQRFVPPTVTEIECLNTVHVKQCHECSEPKPFTKIPLSVMVKMILDKDFDRVADQFYQQASTSSAVPDIEDFVMKQLEGGNNCNQEIFKIKEAICEELEGKMFPTRLPSVLQAPIPMVPPQQDDDESSDSDSDYLNLAVALSMISFCTENRHRQSRQVERQVLSDLSMSQRNFVCSSYFACQIPFRKCAFTTTNPCPRKDLINSWILNETFMSNQVGFPSDIHEMILREANESNSNEKRRVIDVEDYAFKNADNASSVVYNLISKICGLTEELVIPTDEFSYFRGYFADEDLGSCDRLIKESYRDRMLIASASAREYSIV